MNRRSSLLGVCLLAAWWTGCAGDYVAKTRGVRQSYQSYDYGRALSELEAKKPERLDELLVLMDRGMLLHAAGRFEESLKVLAQADKLSQNLDFTSVSEQAVSLLSNEREKAYRGEDFEKLMITVLLALNYAELGRDDDALVEIRRVNERIRKMVVEEKKPYEQLAIARYLGGVMYEDQGEEDSAFIDYYDAYKLNKQLSGSAAEAVLRLAKQTGREDAYRELKARYPDLDETPVGKTEGQLVVIVEAGLSPEKESQNKSYDGGARPELVPIPVYKDRWWPWTASVRVDKQERKASTVTSLSQVAKVHLSDRVGKMVAKQLAGMAVKAGLAAGVGALAKDERIGMLAFVLLNANNVPDLRSWLSLPAEFQVARFRLAPGTHSVSVQAGRSATVHEVEVKPGRIALLVLRRY
jgi:uncharacterized protein